MSETNTENRPTKRKFNRRRRPKSSNQNKDNNQNKKNDRPTGQNERSNNQNKKNDRPTGQNERSNNQNRNRNRKANHLNRSKQKKNSKWNKYRISEHFVKRDFDSRKKDCSCAGSLRISLGLVGVIEAMRAKLNKRIDIITGYYCPECRPRQYGIKRDYHHMGVAADIKVTDMSPVDLFLFAESYPEIKGLGINLDDGHVHIDTRKEDMRESWVEVNDEWILLTDENRDQYIKSDVVEKNTTDESDIDAPETKNDQSATDSEI
ncbi:MAG: D-Ala-D-Ala carboxypeptidase family metallohydrolase [Candidatus Margulisiibacteriota bacterium]|nr:D-Ala-D-Ala carboxypeptidase family metallohydrolase [Candidatus Margulisiibacteriota bacterium]